jgi:hypothetical protein
MFEFFLADANTIFNIAIGIVLVMGLLEGLGLLLGLSLIALFDNLSPIDVDLNVGVNADPDFTVGGMTQIIGWLCLNRLPLMVWMVLFLTCFGIVGYVLNFTAASLFNTYLTSLISIPIALTLGLVLTGKVGSRLANIMPKNETSAISSDTFGGRIATITTGTARKGSPAEASFVDNFNQKHYVMVEPMESEQTFATGEQVVLVQKGKTGWLAINYA